MAEKTIKKVRNPGPSTVGKLYLIAYNCIQTLGWTYMLLQSLSHFLNRGTLDTFWPEIKWTVIIFQNAAVLENLTMERCSIIDGNQLWNAVTLYLIIVVHSLVGLVPSGVFVVLPQVYSRVYLVCGCLMAIDSSTVSPGLPLCVLAWSITEIIRYAYYTLNLIGSVPQPLLFLRYSTFLILYPIGITGELMCMYHSLDEIAEKQLWTVSMPNAWNVAFNYYYFVVFYMFLYIPIFPFLYGHMLAQRRKMLGKDAKKTK